MDSVLKSGKRKRSSECEKCILCNKKGKERFVDSPSDNAYDNLSQTITDFASWQDEQCVSVLQSLNNDASVQNIRLLEVKWHLSCYKSLTHSTRRKSVENKFLTQETTCPTEETLTESPSIPFTRQQKTSRYNKDLCFFCDGKETRKHNLHHVAYDSGGANLRLAVESSGNKTWYVGLSECINPTDAHAIDVLYHRARWAKNVIHVIRKNEEGQDEEGKKGAV